MARHDKESTIMIPLFYEILPFVMYDILIQLKKSWHISYTCEYKQTLCCICYTNYCHENNAI